MWYVMGGTLHFTTMGALDSLVGMHVEPGENAASG